MTKRSVAVWLVFFLILSPSAVLAQQYEDTNRFTYGFQRLMIAPFQILIQTLQGTLAGPPVMGTVSGLLRGTFRTVSDVVGGVFDMGASVAPYAKYAVFFL